MTQTTTVLVIGGGATGVGIVRDLALRGIDATLVDRGGLASGTSGRSHGLLHSGARYAEADPNGAKECIEENRILREIAGECIRDSGGLFVELPEDDSAYFDSKLDACRDLGIPATELTGTEARERVADLSETVQRAFAVPDGVVYPSRLVAATAGDAVEHGATIHTHAPVEAMATTNGEDRRIQSVSVAGSVDDEIRAEIVVNATGAWAEHCAAMADVSVPMRPTKGVMVAVPYEGIEPVLNRCRPPADGDIIIPHDEQVILGTTSVAVDDPDEYATDAAEIELMFDECAAMVPALKGRSAVRPYWGVRPLYALDEDDRGTVDEGTGDARGISRDFTLLDHRADGVENFLTIVGGKLTTHRQMAAAVTDQIADRLGVTTACRTAEQPLAAADDPAAIDALVDQFDARSPADEDVLTQPNRPTS